MNTVLNLLAVKQIRNNILVLLFLCIGFIPFIFKMDSLFVLTFKGDMKFLGTVVSYSFITTMVLYRILYLINQYKASKK